MFLQKAREIHNCNTTYTYTKRVFTLLKNTNRKKQRKKNKKKKLNLFSKLFNNEREYERKKNKIKKKTKQNRTEGKNIT